MAIERRDFLKVIGVSGAGAAATACGGTQTAEKLIPYVVAHEEIVPGIATHYRTTCRECPAGCGMNVKTREGRAIKADGNPLSPIAHGKLCPRGQASLHGLYNPDRVPQALARDGESWQPLTWDAAEQQLADALTQHRGNAVFLTEYATGTLDRLIDEFCAAWGIRRVRWAPFAWEPVRAANRLVFGRDVLPVHDFSAAETVLTFGADFLETWISPIDYAHGFVRGTAYDRGRKGRLISIAPHQSLTDMNAEEWVPAAPGTEHLVAFALARLLMDRGRDAGPAAGMLGGVDVEGAARASGISTERLRQIADAFDRAGASLAVGPGVGAAHRAATQLAVAVAVLNSVAGNIGARFVSPRSNSCPVRSALTPTCRRWSSRWRPARSVRCSCTGPIRCMRCPMRTMSAQHSTTSRSSRRSDVTSTRRPPAHTCCCPTITSWRAGTTRSRARTSHRSYSP
jgi:anaerobic selenocysteine-containing dehydrogenase